MSGTLGAAGRNGAGPTSSSASAMNRLPLRESRIGWEILSLTWAGVLNLFFFHF